MQLVLRGQDEVAAIARCQLKLLGDAHCLVESGFGA
jgi:hypothetical protein